MKPSTSSEEPLTCLGGCGHTLHSAKARARGYGERCWRKLHRRRRRRSIRRLPPPAHPAAIPNQLALELWTEPPLSDRIYGIPVDDIPTHGLL